MLAKIGAALADPYRLLYMLRAQAARGGMDRRYRRLAEQAGFRELFLVLSFDCDTREDADTVMKVHDRVRALGVTPAYAVPGELLNKSERVYRQIAEAGGEFINHGYRDHTYFDIARGRYASCFFYDQLPLNAVRDDIVQGDRNLRSTLGIKPIGFRAPHFGTFQKPTNCDFSTAFFRSSAKCFRRRRCRFTRTVSAPHSGDFGVLELPVSGMGSMPLRILDSWTCFAAPGRRFGPDDFVREGRAAGEKFRSLGIGLLNFYADPSHIHDREEFFETVAYWAKIARPVTYRELLAELS